MARHFPFSMETAEILVCLMSFLVIHSETKNVIRPEGIHMSLGSNPFVDREILWITEESEKTLLLRNHLGQPLKSYTAESLVMNLSDSSMKLWIQRLNLTNLDADEEYKYEVGSSSAQYTFRTWRMRPKHEIYKPPNFLLYGSIDSEDGAKAPIHQRLLNHLTSEHYSAILNLGSMGCGKGLHTFLKNLEDMASMTPYLTTPGPDESRDHYNLYRQLFAMPKVSWPMDRYWYSFYVEKAHIISVDTEAFLPKGSSDIRKAQLDWLKKDLEAANDPTIRNLQGRPWIIVFTHHPLYCSGDPACFHNRVYFNDLEDIFYKYGVDLVIAAQDNHYERTWPVYRGNIHSKNYLFPTYPIHISTPAFTCQSDRPKGYKYAMPDDQQWSAKRMNLVHKITHGYLRIQNETHLFWEERTADDPEITLDTVFIQQAHHGPFEAKIGPSYTVVAIVVSCLACFLIIGGAILAWRKYGNIRSRKKAQAKMRYVHLNEGQLEL